MIEPLWGPLSALSRCGRTRWTAKALLAAFLALLLICVCVALARADVAGLTAQPMSLKPSCVQAGRERLHD